jgi:hypothetical protein
MFNSYPEVTMIDKDKTIANALHKYRQVRPIPGKHNLDECFVCLRGQYFLLFRTSDDKKAHRIRAVSRLPKKHYVAMWLKNMASYCYVFNKPILLRVYILSQKQIHAIDSFYRFMNQKVLIRSLLSTKEQIGYLNRIYAFISKPIPIRSLIMR